MAEEENLFVGDVALTTPYGVVYIRNQGREITFKIHDSLNQSEHNKRLFNYVQWLKDQGADRVNCSHVSFDWLDKSMPLRRGAGILDIVYEKTGRLYECELKTSREIWLERTVQQLKGFEKTCENLILLVPRKDMETARGILKSANLLKTKVDSYEV